MCHCLFRWIIQLHRIAHNIAMTCITLACSSQQKRGRGGAARPALLIPLAPLSQSFSFTRWKKCNCTLWFLYSLLTVSSKSSLRTTTCKKKKSEPLNSQSLTAFVLSSAGFGLWALVSSRNAVTSLNNRWRAFLLPNEMPPGKKKKKKTLSKMQTDYSAFFFFFFFLAEQVNI